jgi:hypothetical protein
MSIEEKKKKARDDWDFSNKMNNFISSTFWKVPD